MFPRLIQQQGVTIAGIHLIDARGYSQTGVSRRGLGQVKGILILGVIPGAKLAHFVVAPDPDVTLLVQRHIVVVAHSHDGIHSLGLPLDEGHSDLAADALSILGIGDGQDHRARLLIRIGQGIDAAVGIELSDATVIHRHGHGGPVRNGVDLRVGVKVKASRIALQHLGPVDLQPIAVGAINIEREIVRHQPSGGPAVFHIASVHLYYIEPGGLYAPVLLVAGLDRQDKAGIPEITGTHLAVGVRTHGEDGAVFLVEHRVPRIGSNGDHILQIDRRIVGRTVAVQHMGQVMGSVSNEGTAVLAGVIIQALLSVSVQTPSPHSGILSVHSAGNQCSVAIAHSHILHVFDNSAIQIPQINRPDLNDLIKTVSVEAGTAEQGLMGRRLINGHIAAGGQVHNLLQHPPIVGGQGDLVGVGLAGHGVVGIGIGNGHILAAALVLHAGVAAPDHHHAVLPQGNGVVGTGINGDHITQISSGRIELAALALPSGGDARIHLGGLCGTGTAVIDIAQLPAAVQTPGPHCAVLGQRQTKLVAGSDGNGVTDVLGRDSGRSRAGIAGIRGRHGCRALRHQDPPRHPVVVACDLTAQLVIGVGAPGPDLTIPVKGNGKVHPGGDRDDIAQITALHDAGAAACQSTFVPISSGESALSAHAALIAHKHLGGSGTVRRIAQAQLPGGIGTPSPNCAVRLQAYGKVLPCRDLRRSNLYSPPVGSSGLILDHRHMDHGIFAHHVGIGIALHLYQHVGFTIPLGRHCKGRSTYSHVGNIFVAHLSPEAVILQADGIGAVVFGSIGGHIILMEQAEARYILQRGFSKLHPQDLVFGHGHIRLLPFGGQGGIGVGYPVQDHGVCPDQIDGVEVVGAHPVGIIAVGGIIIPNGILAFHIVVPRAIGVSHIAAQLAIGIPSGGVHGAVHPLDQGMLTAQGHTQDLVHLILRHISIVVVDVRTGAEVSRLADRRRSFLLDILAVMIAGHLVLDAVFKAIQTVNIALVVAGGHSKVIAKGIHRHRDVVDSPAIAHQSGYCRQLGGVYPSILVIAPGIGIVVPGDDQTAGTAQGQSTRATEVLVLGRGGTRALDHIIGHMHGVPTLGAHAGLVAHIVAPDQHAAVHSHGAGHTVIGGNGHDLIQIPVVIAAVQSVCHRQGPVVIRTVAEGGHCAVLHQNIAGLISAGYGHSLAARGQCDLNGIAANPAAPAVDLPCLGHGKTVGVAGSDSRHICQGLILSSKHLVGIGVIDAVASRAAADLAGSPQAPGPDGAIRLQRQGEVLSAGYHGSGHRVLLLDGDGHLAHIPPVVVVDRDGGPAIIALAVGRNGTAGAYRYKAIIHRVINVGGGIYGGGCHIIQLCDLIAPEALRVITLQFVHLGAIALLQGEEAGLVSKNGHYQNVHILVTGAHRAVLAAVLTVGVLVSPLTVAVVAADPDLAVVGHVDSLGSAHRHIGYLHQPLVGVHQIILTVIAGIHRRGHTDACGGVHRAQVAGIAPDIQHVFHRVAAGLLSCHGGGVAIGKEIGNIEVIPACKAHSRAGNHIRAVDNNGSIDGRGSGTQQSAVAARAIGRDGIVIPQQQSIAVPSCQAHHIAAEIILAGYASVLAQNIVIVEYGAVPPQVGYAAAHGIGVQVHNMIQIPVPAVLRVQTSRSGHLAVVRSEPTC